MYCVHTMYCVVHLYNANIVKAIGLVSSFTYLHFGYSLQFYRNQKLVQQLYIAVGSGEALLAIQGAIYTSLVKQWEDAL